MDDEKICYISGSDIFSENSRTPRKSKKRKRSADSIQFSDLHKGDYVVHEAHGIGRFEGIRPVTADGQTRDYIVIRYAGSDVLYIPTEQLDVIQKYIGNSGNAPVLSKLSGGSWKRTRERAKKAIMEIAEDLVKLYAERQAMGGYAFGEDTVWQREFEADFPYTETDDQLRAVEEIKEDMEKAAKIIGDAYGCAVLLKGGHCINDANDLLYANGIYKWFSGERIDNPNTHGTGCTLSSAIASNLAKGYDLEASIQRAKGYISDALAAMLDLGAGSGPMNHAFALTGKYSESNHENER
jgi:hypothetical protein